MYLYIFLFSSLLVCVYPTLLPHLFNIYICCCSSYFFHLIILLFVLLSCSPVYFFGHPSNTIWNTHSFHTSNHNSRNHSMTQVDYDRTPKSPMQHLHSASTQNGGVPFKPVPPPKPKNYRPMVQTNGNGNNGNMPPSQWESTVRLLKIFWLWNNLAKFSEC